MLLVDIIHVSRCRPTTTHVYNIRSCKYSLDAADDERKYRSKRVEQPRNNKLSYTVATCWSFCILPLVQYALRNGLTMASPQNKKTKLIFDLLFTMVSNFVSHPEGRAHIKGNNKETLKKKHFNTLRTG